jgi:hypothetical protein
LFVPIHSRRVRRLDNGAKSALQAVYIQEVSEQSDEQTNGQQNTVYKQSLATIRQKSIRRGIWFTALNGIERGIMNIVIKCVETVRSGTVLQTISAIVAKISNAMNFLTKIEVLGKPMAEKLSSAFEKWGNQTARNWKHDRAYIRHLGLDLFHSHQIWSLQA